MKITTPQQPDGLKSTSLPCTTFPINISQFKISPRSSPTCSAPSLSQTKTLPTKSLNLFQYNDRSPLMFSSDQQDYEPHFYKSQTPNVQLPLQKVHVEVRIINNHQSESQSKSKIQTKSNTNSKQKLNKKSHQENQKKIPLVPSQNLQQDQQDEENFNVRQLLGTQFLKLDNLNAHKVSLKTQPKAFDKYKQSQVSKTDQILDQIKLQQASASQYINIEDHPQNPVTITPPRKRRNKIFGNTGRTQKDGYTPQKYIQTHIPRSSNNMYSSYQNMPQMKALSVLDKLVQQIGSHTVLQQNAYSRLVSQSSVNVNQQSVMLNQTQLVELGAFNSALQRDLTTFNRVSSIEKLTQSHLLTLRANCKSNIAKWQQNLKTSFQEWLQLEPIKTFNVLTEEFQIIDLTIERLQNAKKKLNELQIQMKSLMILLQRRQFKKVFAILKQVTRAVQKLSQMRASCQQSRLEKMLSEYLQGEIQLLSQVERDTHQHFQDLVAAQKV